MQDFDKNTEFPYDTPTYSLPNNTPPEPKKKSKKFLIPIIIGGVITVIFVFFLIVGIVCWAIFGNMPFSFSLKGTKLPAETVSNALSYEEEMVMPNCQGMQLEDVKVLFHDTEYSVTYQYQESNTVPQNEIIGQNIESGTALSSNSSIVFIVSNGATPCPYPYSQKIVVTANNKATKGQMTLYQWENGTWTQKYSCSATLGKNGIGYNYGEGKGITPAGTFKLGVVLSKSPLTHTNWPYQQVTQNTCIVDDVNSPLYNTIQNRSTLPQNVHYDPIGNTIINGNSNKCMYIEHNGDGISSQNVVSGKGSAITICGKTSSLYATAGCIDISISDFNYILEQLDYEQNPHIEISVNE